jgi:8-oxo-dGTP pyrophosphatase MutT (NUDIX family)
LDLAEVIRKYGLPKKLQFAADFMDFEADLVRKSVAKGRHHDITCFIKHKGLYAVIQKHAYARTGIFRAPSGGLNSKETIEEAAKREMKEETGLDIELIRLVLDINLDVITSEKVLPWRSLVFLADSVHGELQPIDKFEIYNARLMSREELLGDVYQLMVNSGWGGFQYRAFLTKSFFEELDILNL